jgi:hypothetical protein
MSKDIQLEFYQTQLANLEEDYKRVTDQLQVEQDGVAQNKLERQIKQIGQQMDEWQKKIDQRQADMQSFARREALNNLIDLLKNYTDQFEAIAQAYKQTVSHWSVAIRSNVQTVDDIITELEKLPPKQYSARQEFIAHLIQQSSDLSLTNDLKQWWVQYSPEIDWLQLHTEIEAAQDKRLENAQPAILITIARSDEASTQAQDDETYYQFNAWLIEDIQTYQQQKTGYHSLLAIDSPNAQPCLLEHLIQTIPQLLNTLISEQNQLCNKCKNDPQIHVFLPLELMHLGVDVWSLSPEPTRRPKYLGHDYLVVIRCANRYDSSYRKSPSWRKLWDRHQSLLRELAHDVFVPGHDQDLDNLMDTLEEAAQPNVEDGKIVGLHVTQEPIDIQELCYELLDSGLPLAIWSRENLAESGHETQLVDLLKADCLEQLPHTVKTKRRETRRNNPPDRHIGHHLSLLWDDPNLVPPKSA